MWYTFHMSETFEQTVLRELKSRAATLAKTLASGGWNTLSEGKALVGRIQGLDDALTIIEACIRETTKTKDQ